MPDCRDPHPRPLPTGGGERKHGPTSFSSEPTPITSRRAAIDRLFAGASVEAILAALDSETGPDAEFARANATAIRTKAPISLKIALAQVRRGRALSFADCMRTEFRIVSRVAYGEDFYEGIRAVIVDKDNRPCWHPATLAEVTPEMVEGYFAPLAAELDLP